METQKWTKAKIRRILGPTLVVAGLLYTYRSHFNHCPHEIILGAWIIIPPIWFFIEYNLLFDKKTEDFEHLKYEQELARNLWAGIVVLLGALYLGKWD